MTGPVAHERVGMFTEWALDGIASMLEPAALRHPTLNEITMAAEQAGNAA